MTEDESMKFYDVLTAHEQTFEAFQQFSYLCPCNEDLSPLIRVLSDAMSKTISEVRISYLTLLRAAEGPNIRL